MDYKVYRDLSIKVAEEIFNCEVTHMGHDHYNCVEASGNSYMLKEYSLDTEHAKELIEKMLDLGWTTAINVEKTEGGVMWNCYMVKEQLPMNQFNLVGKRLETVISRLALTAIRSERNFEEFKGL